MQFCTYQTRFGMMSSAAWPMRARQQLFAYLQLNMDASGGRCNESGVGHALIPHSTIAECDHTHASYVDPRFACHSQVASQGTGAVNVRNADMAMY
jgi:hypothetical protein